MIKSGMGTDYSFNDGGKLRPGYLLPRTVNDLGMATDAAIARRSKPASKFKTPNANAYARSEFVIADHTKEADTMPTDNTLTKAMSALVSMLQDKMPCPELDDIDVMLNGPTDGEGNVTSAMDRRVKRQASQSLAADARKGSGAYLERFPNASRLAR